MMKNAKLAMLLALVLALAIGTAACMTGGNVSDGNVGEGQYESTPQPGGDFMPDGNQQNGGSRQTNGNQQTDGIMTGNAGTAGNTANYDWNSRAADVESKISAISEISESRVVVTGDTALVGVKFDKAYQGEMTERIREMVAAEVMAADPHIKTVAVTAYDDDVKEIYDLSDRVGAGEKMDTLKEDINEIVRNATTLR